MRRSPGSTSASRPSQAPPSAKDCLPGDADQRLQELGIDPCVVTDPADGRAAVELQRLQQAAVAGRLSGQQYYDLVRVIQAVRNARS